MNNHLQYWPRSIQVKLDEQVIETIPIFLSPLWHSPVWHSVEFTWFCLLLLYPQKSLFSLSLITAFLHDLGLSFCCITFRRTVHVTCYGIWPCTCLLWFPRPAVAHLLWPQTSSGMRQDHREVWTNQTNGGCLICTAGRSSSVMKSFLLSLMVRKAIVSPFRWRITCSAWMLSEKSLEWIR